MNVHDILLGMQYATVSALFIEIVIVFLRWKNTIHSCLVFACVCSFLSNMGYLFEMKAQSEEAYILAIKFSYIGRVWIAFAFFLFSARICRVKIPKRIILPLVIVHFLIYLSVLTIGSNGLYYKDYKFVADPEFPKFYHSNGSMHDLLMLINLVLVAFAMGWVIRAYRKETHKKVKRRYMTLILAFGVQTVSWVMQVAHIFPITKFYDISMPGALVGTVFMLIAIFKFDLMGTREIAKDFAVDRISEGIIAVDNEGRIQYYNEPMTKLYPEFETFFSESISLSLTAKSIKTPYDILDDITSAVASGETITIGERIYTPEENDLVYGGEKYGKLYALVDDTEHYRYMEELQEQRDIADNANEAKSRFLASMSHEIRTPINAVLGMDEMILRESQEKTIRSYAADIMSAGKTLLSLINDILDLSKVEEGKMEIIPAQYDLSSLINDLINMIRDRAQKKGLKFKVIVDEKIPRFLIGDEIRVRQCVMNLLTNAVKYTEVGEVTLRVSYEKKDDRRILLGFCVKDTGIGMKPEDMENLFAPYKRIEEKRNRAIEGTGLGMSITRQLLDLMGSSLSVQSEYAKGSEFSFSVCQEVDTWEEIGDIMTRLKSASEDTYEYHELFHAPKARILVVDDTEVNLTVIESLLKKTRINIDTAMSGKDAISFSDKNAYDIIFIDHMMPDMDGIETLHHIRKSGMSKDAPAVALTANAVYGAKEMYLEAGFTGYLSKPVEGEKLERMIFELLPKDKISDGEDAVLKEEAASSVETASEHFVRLLEQIPELDFSAGLLNLGSEEGYKSVLSVFHLTAKEKANEIESFYKNGDTENYVIKVHALKSSARIIGATDLSKLAAALEDAGRRGDTAYLKLYTEELLFLYRTLDEKLTCLERANENLPKISEKELKKVYASIAEIAESMDYDRMEESMKYLHGYCLSESENKRVNEIERMFIDFDWDGIVQTVKGALEK